MVIAILPEVNVAMMESEPRCRNRPARRPPPARPLGVCHTATEGFTNPAGNVLGAFLAAMLYDTVGPALLATLEPDQFQSTLELHTRFLRSVS
jgi:hypothetical protein